jgi:hypothetical protein
MKSPYKAHKNQPHLITPETCPEAYENTQKRGKFGRTVRKHTAPQPLGRHIVTGKPVHIKPGYVSATDLD